jgi:Putative DNA-binding domain
VQLPDLQADIATAVVEGAIPKSASLLIGGDEPTRRFAIHSRHYSASLARSLVERFSATVWLAGSDFVREAAMGFVREHPPARPCIAEYGDGFPAYLASNGGTRLPYLAQFATVDWHLGRLAIAVDAPPLQTLADCDPARFADTRLTLQPGTEYVALDWSLDELIRFYLAGDAPNQYALRNEPVWLELRGCRGDLWLNRLTRSDYVFRLALADGSTLERAAELAVRADESFEPGRAVLAMLRAGLLTSVKPQAEGAES